MGNNGNLHIGELQKHKEDLNKTGGSIPKRRSLIPPGTARIMIIRMHSVQGWSSWQTGGR